WYPTMRLFRQRQLYDWDEVFERMAAELQRKVETSAAIHHVAAEPAAAPPRATVCILTYGDYLVYFRRCLESVLQNTPAGQIELRLGFNAAPASFAYARERLGLRGDDDGELLPGGVRRTAFAGPGGMTVRLWNSPVNLYKEPMARLLYHDVPLATAYA